MTAAIQFLSLLLIVATPVAYGAEHLVGGGAGWSKAADYTAWSAGENFTVGDTLLFKYGKDHLVYEVTEDDYKKCGIGDPISVQSGGDQTVISLNLVQGTLYPQHLVTVLGGMKLAINVKDGKNLRCGGSNNPVIARSVLDGNSPSPPTISGGGGAPLKCPGGGGPNPPNPFIFGPPNPYFPGSYHGGASNLGKMSGLMMGFYSLLVLVISFMV